MSNREEDGDRNREEDGDREEETIGSISYNNPVRGYSNRHSSYDNAFNMDFEYSYIDLLSNYGAFVSRAQEMYSNIETCISTIIETQHERRRLVNIRRERERYNRSLREQRYIVSDNGRGIERATGTDTNAATATNTSTLGSILQSNNHQASVTRESREPRESRESVNTSTRVPGTTPASQVTPLASAPPTRRNLFDPNSFIYTTPRTVLLPPIQPIPSLFANLYNTSHRRTTSEGLTIRQIEENTEITTFGSIPSNDILNTECPITRETFTPESVVLKLKICKHCFIPFRMMVWLETHSTCPLCRSVVVQTNIPETSERNLNDVGVANDANDANDANIVSNNTSISDIFRNIINSNSHDLNNLSIDNVNDNSIMFSFDLPLPNERSNLSSDTIINNNAYIVDQLERIMSNAILPNVSTNGNSPSIETNNDVAVQGHSDNNSGNDIVIESDSINRNENGSESRNFPEVD